MQLGQFRRQRLIVEADRGLGQLERDAIGRQAVACKTISQEIAEAFAAHLQLGHIEGDALAVQPLVQPCAHLPAQQLERPFANVDDQAALFCEWNELARQYEPALRMLPAQQRFQSGQLACVGINARLEIQLQLVGADSLLQILLQLNAPLQFGRMLGREHPVLRLAGRLGGVHRDIRILQQLLRFRRMVGEDRNADRGRHRERAPGGCLVQSIDRAYDARSALFDITCAGDIFDHHREFIATQPDHRVIQSHRGFQAGSDIDQHPVTCLVAQRVIDDLEIVEVDEQQRHLAPALAAGAQDHGQVIDQPAPVGQAGQCIGDSHLRQRLLLAARLGHVTHRDGDTCFGLHAAPLYPAGRCDPGLAAVMPAYLDLVLDQPLLQDTQQESMHARIVLGSHQLAHGPPQHAAAFQVRAPRRLFIAVLDHKIAHHPLLPVQRPHHVQRLQRAFDRLSERFLDSAHFLAPAIAAPLQRRTQHRARDQQHGERRSAQDFDMIL